MSFSYPMISGRNIRRWNAREQVEEEVPEDTGAAESLIAINGSGRNIRKEKDKRFP